MYVTDCLYTLCGWSGNRPARRYRDILWPEPEDDRPGLEIAAERLAGYGIEVVDG